MSGAQQNPMEVSKQQNQTGSRHKIGSTTSNPSPPECPELEGRGWVQEHSKGPSSEHSSPSLYAVGTRLSLGKSSPGKDRSLTLCGPEQDQARCVVAGHVRLEVGSHEQLQGRMNSHFNIFQ